MVDQTKKIDSILYRGLWITITISSLLCLLAWYVWPQRFSVSDAVAQFLPISVEGYRSIKSGALPLFNFYQHLGHPILEVGYYPVLYPVWWIACLVAEYCLGDIQQAWNILCCIQIILGCASGYLFCISFLGLKPIFAISSGLLSGFSGSTIFLSEWFYALVVTTFTPLILVGIKACILRPHPIKGIALAILIGLFFFSSNIQFLFYSFHFILFGIIALFICLIIDRVAISKIRQSLVTLCILCISSILLLAPYLYGLSQHASKSTREIGKVPLEKYFWLTNNLWLSLKNSWLPVSGAGEVMWHTPFLYHIGFAPMVGICLFPILLCYLAYTREWKSLIISVFLFGSAIIAFLLSIGPAGGIATLLYNFAPYNWFRHSIKWMPFYQLFTVFAGIYCISELIRKFGSNKVNLLTERLVLLLTVGGLFWFISIVDNPKRLTETGLPLPKPVLADTQAYRHVGFWPEGALYEDGGIHGKILCHNFSSLWKLPTVAGYEPMGLKQNIETALNNWHPGCFLHYSTLNLDALLPWGVRFLRVPTNLSSDILKEITFRYPHLQFQYLGTDKSLNSDVIEILNAKPLVHGPHTRLESLTFENNSLLATVVSTESDKVVFSWLKNEHFIAFRNGQAIKLLTDDYKRVRLRLPQAGRYELRLTYSPQNLLLLFKYCYLAFGALVFVTFSYTMIRRSINRI